MDADRFDAFSRALSAPRQRRSLAHLVAGLVFGGTAVTGWLAEAEAKRKRRRKGKGKGKKKKRRKKKGQNGTPPPPPPPRQCPPSCPECQQCVNGQSCTPINGGVCQNNACKVCQGGSCVNNNGIDCGNSLCKECQGGQCVNKQNGTTCNGTGKCENGTCKPAPDCNPKGTACTAGTASEEACCSKECTSGTCETSELNEPCITSSDCNTGLAAINFCDLDFECQEPVVAP